MSLGQLQLCVLASGSGGNCSLLRTPAGNLLIDIGIGPRTFAQRVASLGEDPRAVLQQIAGVCVTHLDSDHFNANWFLTLAKFNIPIYCHESRRGDVLARVAEVRSKSITSLADGDSLSPSNESVTVHGFDDRTCFEPIAGLRLASISCAHDETGSHGFLIDGFGTRIGYATDLGHVPDGLLDLFCRLDVLCIESNYDRRMQLESDRPWFLKRRVMGGKGHLSNDEAFDTVKRLLDRCECEGHPLPRHIVLLHRSRECNCPDLLRQYFSRDARIARRLTLAEQSEPTAWLAPGVCAGDQMTLAWG